MMNRANKEHGQELRDLDRYLTAAVCLSLAVNWELPVDGWMKPS